MLYLRLPIYSFALFFLLTSCGTATLQKESTKGISSQNASLKSNRNLDESDILQGKQEYIKGISAFEAGDYSESLNHLLIAAVKIPNTSGINFALADTYYRMNDYTNATYYAQQAVTIEPDNPWYLLRLSEIFQKSGDLTNATEVLRSLTRDYPEDINFKFRLATLLIQQGKFLDANDIYSSIIKIKGDNLIAREQRIKNFFAMNMLDSALEEMESLLLLQPDNNDLRLEIAKIYEQQGKIDKAIERYKDLLKRDTVPEVMVALAELYIKSNQFDNLDKMLTENLTSPTVSSRNKENLVVFLVQSVTDYEDRPELSVIAEKGILYLLKQNRETTRIVITAANFYLTTGKIESALALFQKATDLQPGNAQVWIQRIQILLEQNRYDEAVAVGLQANEYVPENAVIYYFIGVAHYSNDNKNEALTWLEKSVNYPARLNFKSIIYGLIADIYYTLDQWPKAKKAYEESIKLDKDNATALNNLAYYLSLRNENLDKAQMFSKRSISIEPMNPSFLDTYGWILYLQGKSEEALTYLELSVESGGSSSDIYDHLGEVHHTLGNASQALFWWERALKKDPGNIDIQNKIKINQ